MCVMILCHGQLLNMSKEPRHESEGLAAAMCCIVPAVWLSASLAESDRNWQQSSANNIILPCMQSHLDGLHLWHPITS